MYGSDKEYAAKPHQYVACTCFNKDPHCWYCGKKGPATIHAMITDVSTKVIDTKD